MKYLAMSVSVLCLIPWILMLLAAWSWSFDLAIMAVVSLGLSQLWARAVETIIQRKTMVLREVLRSLGQ